MSEFTLHHHVSQLMTLLGVRSSDTVGEEVYTERLLSSRTPFNTELMASSMAKKKVAESTSKPIEFFAKYDELKGKNVRDLDPLVYLLSKLCEDKETKEFLAKNAEDKARKEGLTLIPHSNVTSLLPAAGTKMTERELFEIKETLFKEAKNVDKPSSDFLTKALREKKQTRKVNIPQQPDWLFQRPYLTLDFVAPTEVSTNTNIVALGTLPPHTQEQAVLDDLLLCMRGIDGKYIISRGLPERYAAKEFLIDQSLDISVQELVKRILPICSNYSIVVRFIEEKSSFEYGLVNHALSSAMETLIKDYMVLVAQLEQQMKLGQLTLQKLCYYLQPTMRVLEILASVANSINRGKCIGGAVLSLLHEKTASMIGDSRSSQLCLYLTQTACVPYMEIVEKWIYRGIIVDPYSEFLVEENQKINKEKLQEDYNDAFTFLCLKQSLTCCIYWEKHYSVFRERIPVFLEQVAVKILNTGKYLNVVRQCGRDVRCPFAEELVYTIKERRYYDQIERAYSYASRLLLSLLMEEKELLARLKSIKHYFLLDKGDFIVQFMDMTEVEMKQHIDDILPSRLESLLELALRTSTANVDPFKDDLRVDLLPFDLTSQLLQILSIDSRTERDYRVDTTDIRLSGLESFSFDYVVRWPVSLVVSRKVLTRYQILFRHLFYCKHVERQLCSVWMGNKQTKLYALSSSRWYSPAFALRQRMLNFVQNFEYYMMFEVIEPNWHVFMQNMSKVSNVDDVLAFHWDFLDSCLKDCMLTSTELLRIVHKLLVVCVTFSNYVQVMAEPVDQDQKDENFEKTIETFDRNFSCHLLKFLDKIMDENTKTYEHKLFKIIYRLDFNNFYTERLEAMSAGKTVKDLSAE
ncbi:unnamed protein product, partial [Candidula unifasciata]